MLTLVERARLCASRRLMVSPIEKADVPLEALRYIRRFTGKVMVSR